MNHTGRPKHGKVEYRSISAFSYRCRLLFSFFFFFFFFFFWFDTNNRAIEMMILSDLQCQTYGYILDGFPMMMEHVREDLLPRKIIELVFASEQAALSEAEARAHLAGQPWVPELFSARFGGTMQQLPKLRAHYTKNHRNWHQLPAFSSRWRLSAAAAAIVESNVRHVQDYVRAVKTGRPAPVADFPIVPAKLQAGLSAWGDLCPGWGVVLFFVF